MSLPSSRVMFFLLYKLTDEGVFDDFPKICDHFSKISEGSFKIVSKARRNVPNIFREFPKNSEDSPRLWRKTRRCLDDTPTNLSTYNLREKVDISEIIDIFTCADIVLLSVCYHSVYH